MSSRTCRCAARFSSRVTQPDSTGGAQSGFPSGRLDPARRRLPPEHAAAAVAVRAIAPLREHLLHGRPFGEAFQRARLAVEPLQRTEFLLAPELRVRPGGFEHPDGLIANPAR